MEKKKEKAGAYEIYSVLIWGWKGILKSNRRQSAVVVIKDNSDQGENGTA